MSTCPLYQKRGDQLVPVLVIDEAPSSDPSAAGHLVDSNGIQTALDALEAKIPTDPVDTGDFMHLSGNKKETATGDKTFTDDVFMDKCLYVDDALEVNHRIDCDNFWGVKAFNFYYNIVGSDIVISPDDPYQSIPFTSDFGINIENVSFADNIEPGDYSLEVSVSYGNLGHDRDYKKLTAVVNYTPFEGANLRLRWVNNEPPSYGLPPVTWVGSGQPSTFVPGANVFEFLFTKDAIYGHFIGPKSTDPTGTTYSDMVGATASDAGEAGLVPAPAAGKHDKFLRGDGTFDSDTISGSAFILNLGNRWGTNGERSHLEIQQTDNLVERGGAGFYLPEEGHTPGWHEILTDDKGKAVSAGYADSAGLAANLVNNDNPSTYMTFNWSGRDGQPAWVWGGDNLPNMYVYNPANFNVNHANSADWAQNAGRADGAGWADQAQYAWNMNAGAVAVFWAAPSPNGPVNVYLPDGGTWRLWSTGPVGTYPGGTHIAHFDQDVTGSGAGGHFSGIAIRIV